MDLISGEKILHFNSRPHKEVDAAADSEITLSAYFNSRPHKEVDQTVFADPAVDRIFQFTTSQGGRRPASTGEAVYYYFNSRPHKEVDCMHGSISYGTKHFNSRPHKEVDNDYDLGKTSKIISIHDLTRRSTDSLRRSRRRS